MKKGLPPRESASQQVEVVRSDTNTPLDQERLRQGLRAWGFNGRYPSSLGEGFAGNENHTSNWYFGNAHDFNNLVSSLRGRGQYRGALFVTMIEGSTKESVAVIVSTYQPDSIHKRGGGDTACTYVAEMGNDVAAEVLSQIRSSRNSH